MKKLLLYILLFFSMSFVYAENQTAIFAGGCFWCMQSDFDKLKGVTKTEAGYDGGIKPNPNYQTVSAGDSGYSEALRVTFDPKLVTYVQVLDYYWHHIDPTDDRGQFCDKGSEYRSKIFYLNPQQQAQAIKSLASVKKSLATVYTEIVPSTTFYLAEEYHQDYYKKNPTRYEFYRWNCGRDKTVEKVWSDATK